MLRRIKAAFASELHDPSEKQGLLTNGQPTSPDDSPSEHKEHKQPSILTRLADTLGRPITAFQPEHLKKFKSASVTKPKPSAKPKSKLFPIKTAGDAETTFSLMNFNIGCLPMGDSLFQINRSELSKNTPRIFEISDFLHKWAAGTIDWNKIPIKNLPDFPDVICFEEAWTRHARETLQVLLADLFPFNTGILGEQFPWGSGCITFSRRPILASNFEKFDNAMLGPEWLVGKGTMQAFIDFGHPYCIEVNSAHMHGGNGFPKKQMYTTSARGGDQMGLVARRIQDNLLNQTPELQGKSRVVSMFAADTNSVTNDENNWKSISSGACQKTNGCTKGETKYAGKDRLYKLFRRDPLPADPSVENALSPAKAPAESSEQEDKTTIPLPINFANIRAFIEEMGKKKTVVPVLKARAIAEGNFPGTTIIDDYLRASRKTGLPIDPLEDTDPRIYDATETTETYAGIPFEIKSAVSTIIPILNPQGLATSDHHARHFTVTFQPRPVLDEKAKNSVQVRSHTPMQSEKEDDFVHIDIEDADVKSESTRSNRLRP